MMTVKDFLTETMDMTLAERNSLPYKKVMISPRRSYYSFRTNNAEIEVMFDRYQTDDKTTFFGLQFIDTADGAVIATGKGNVAAVFSTVVKILREFIQKNNRPLIFFAAMDKEKSRASMYSMFVRNVSDFIPGYEGRLLDRRNFFIGEKDKLKEFEEKSSKLILDRKIKRSKRTIDEKF